MICGLFLGLACLHETNSLLHPCDLMPFRASGADKDGVSILRSGAHHVSSVCVCAEKYIFKNVQSGVEHHPSKFEGVWKILVGDIGKYSKIIVSRHVTFVCSEIDFSPSVAIVAN